MKRKKDVLTEETKESISQKRAYISQSKIPLLSLSETIRLAQSLYDDFAGKPTAPHQIAISVDISPTSSNWRDLCGASILQEMFLQKWVFLMTDLTTFWAY